MSYFVDKSMVFAHQSDSVGVSRLIGLQYKQNNTSTKMQMHTQSLSVKFILFYKFSANDLPKIGLCFRSGVGTFE